MTLYTQKDMTEVLAKWLFDTIGINFMKASQDGTRLDGQYGTLRIISTNERAIPEQTYAEVDGDDTQIDETIRMWNEVVFSVQVYRNTEGGSTALDIARLIELNLRMSATIEHLAVNGLGLVRYSPVKGFDVQAHNVLEPRANIDITFNVYQTLTARGDNIEGISVTGKTSGPQGNETENTQLIKRSP